MLVPAMIARAPVVEPVTCPVIVCIIFQVVVLSGLWIWLARVLVHVVLREAAKGAVVTAQRVVVAACDVLAVRAQLLFAHGAVGVLDAPVPHKDAVVHKRGLVTTLTLIAPVLYLVLALHVLLHVHNLCIAALHRALLQLLYCLLWQILSPLRSKLPATHHTDEHEALQNCQY